MNNITLDFHRRRLDEIYVFYIVIIEHNKE